MRQSPVLLVALCALGCAPIRAGSGPLAPAPLDSPAPATITLTLLGTSDVHGHVESERAELKLEGGVTVAVERGGLALFGGYVNNARLANPGRVVLLDGGDMLQGTMISNLGEGQVVVRAMNALGYTAAAVGNHEFDFGPVGPNSVVKAPGEDPRGVIKARAGEARYAWLSANVVGAKSGAPLADGVKPFVVVDVDGVKLGIVGGTTEDVPRTTRSANLDGLRVDPLASAIAGGAASARAAGATVVIVVVHEGGECHRFDTPDDPEREGCRPDAEVFKLARALPVGAVDAIFAGHTHQGVAARMNGIPILQAYAEARSFSRLDLTVDRASGHVVPGGAVIHPPTEICAEVSDGNGSCDARRARGRAVLPASYEGRPVVIDPAVVAAIARDVAMVAELRARPIGVTLGAPITRRHREESALGNLGADAFRRMGHTDIGMTNGGGLRADLPAGALLEGALFQAFPFDNRMAILSVRGAALRRLLENNLAGEHGILSLSGMSVVATCDGTTLRAQLRLDSGKAVTDDAVYSLATSDFLAQGGDDFGELGGPDKSGVRVVSIAEDGPVMRDLVAAELRKRGPAIAGDQVFYDPARPRVTLPRPRPYPCKNVPQPVPANAPPPTKR